MMEAEEPTRVKFLKLTDEPKEIKLNTLHELPALIPDLNDNEDPREACSTIDISVPTLRFSLTLKLLPSLT
jgi:hypothetical protein